jgi:hypothetical protein
MDVMARDFNLPDVLEWEVYESLHGDRSTDWFWGVGLSGVVIGIIAIILHNVLLAILAVIGAVTLVAVSLKHPTLYSYALTPRGVIEGETLYPWSELDVFWVQETDPAMLLIRSNRATVPLLDLPLPETADTQLVHDYMFQYIDDEPLRLGTLQQIMNRLGFY